MRPPFCNVQNHIFDYVGTNDVRIAALFDAGICAIFDGLQHCKILCYFRIVLKHKNSASSFQIVLFSSNLLRL